MIAARTTFTTKDHQPVALLFEAEGGQTILKAYPSPDGKRIRIVLPELSSFKQARIDIDSGYIDFVREA